MKTLFECPECGYQAEGNISSLNKPGKCPKCKKSIILTEAKNQKSAALQEKSPQSSLEKPTNISSENTGELLLEKNGEQETLPKDNYKIEKKTDLTNGKNTTIIGNIDLNEGTFVDFINKEKTEGKIKSGKDLYRFKLSDVGSSGTIKKGTKVTFKIKENRTDAYSVELKESQNSHKDIKLENTNKHCVENKPEAALIDSNSINNSECNTADKNREEFTKGTFEDFIGDEKNMGKLKSGKHLYKFNFKDTKYPVNRYKLRKGSICHFKIKENGIDAYDVKLRVSYNIKEAALSKFAIMGPHEKYLPILAGMALEERWDYKKNYSNKFKHPILYKYLRYTYEKLESEDKIIIRKMPSTENEYASFNTGLVNQHYDPIMALFDRNLAANEVEPKWKFKSFCVFGEGEGGYLMMQVFSGAIPVPANYFDNSTDILLDYSLGEPNINIRHNHIIIDNSDRLPSEFYLKHSSQENLKAFSCNGEINYDKLREYLKTGLEGSNKESLSYYNKLYSDLNAAIELTLKRVRWNYKTAIPKYYPEHKRIDLLIPLCLIDPQTVDVALTLEKITSEDGISYFGRTAFPLDWAYEQARLVCRPDSDWLSPSVISGMNIDDELSD